MIIIEGEPEIYEKELKDFGKYFEVEWWLNESPNEDWLLEFEKMLKPWLEKEGSIIGPYKPKIMKCLLISTVNDKEEILKQKDFFEKEFFEKINKKLD